MKSIYHCKKCGHHINLDEDGNGYCPICDKEVGEWDVVPIRCISPVTTEKINKDAIIDYLLNMLEEEHMGMEAKARNMVKEKFGAEI